MGLPSEDRPPGAANGLFYDEHASAPQGSQVNGGQTTLPYRQYSGTDIGAGQTDGSGVQGDGMVERNPRERLRANGRRPSGQQRTCGKCGQHLTGQFVRALGDTYHLECFTCRVGLRVLACSLYVCWTMR